MLEAHYAVPLIGAALVSINIRLSAPEVSYIIDHSDARVVVVDSAFASLVVPAELPKVRTYVTVCDVDDEIAHGSLEYEQFLASGSAEPMAADIDSEDQLLTINSTEGCNWVGLRKILRRTSEGARVDHVAPWCLPFIQTVISS